MKRYARLLFIGFLGAYGLCASILDPMHWFWPLNGPDLLFHEAGHPIFHLTGSAFLGALGGTLMQLIVPLAVAGHFWFRHDRYAAAVMFFWFGQNFIHISIYVKDARAQVLPLVGSGDHDWNYMLGRLNLLDWDVRIGDFLWCAGVFLMGLAAYAGWHWADQNRSEAN